MGKGKKTALVNQPIEELSDSNGLVVSKILDEYVKTTSCHHKHASAVLSGKRQRVKRPIRRPRQTVYTVEDARALEILSDWFDGINSKLLRAMRDACLNRCM